MSRSRTTGQPIENAHIEPDGLLLYCLQDTAIRFERTGTHSDLFD
jgi:mRNA interferase YafQ